MGSLAIKELFLMTIGASGLLLRVIQSLNASAFAAHCALRANGDIASVGRAL